MGYRIKPTQRSSKSYANKRTFKEANDVEIEKTVPKLDKVTFKKHEKGNKWEEQIKELSDSLVKRVIQENSMTPLYSFTDQ